MVYRHQPRRRRVLQPPHRRLPRARSRCPPRRRVPKRLSLMHYEFIEQWPQSLVQEVSECGDHHRRFAIAHHGRVFSRVASSRVPSDVQTPRERSFTDANPSPARIFIAFARSFARVRAVARARSHAPLSHAPHGSIRRPDRRTIGLSESSTSTRRVAVLLRSPSEHSARALGLRLKVLGYKATYTVGMRPLAP